MIYLDNASTTKIDQRVLEAMMPYLTDEYGNAGTLYSLGRNAKAAIEHARAQAAEFIGAEPEQIVFTSGGTEANNMVFLSLLGFLKESEKTHVITASNEHVSVLDSVRNLCIKHDFGATYLKTDERGCIYPGAVKSALHQRPDAGLVSIMYMNNETGSENPVADIGEVCREYGVLFHTDCVQAAGCCKLDVNRINCDFLSISSHKIHGPKGVGALYIRNKEICEPVIIGGSVQEFGLRGGTENVAGIAGFGSACEIMSHELHEADIHTSTLKQLFYGTLHESLSADGIGDILHINGAPVVCHGKTLNIRFDNVDGETLLLMLDSMGVCVSAGSACHSHESKPSHVLLSLGASPEDARNSIRVSFSKMNTRDEAEKAAVIMADCVKKLCL